MAALHSLPWLFVAFAVNLAVPTPGRIPKVYNALITSNQNLEPSKAFPVYQPVLHNAFPFPLQTVVYGDYPLTNGLVPVSAVPPKDATAKPEETPSSTAAVPLENASEDAATEKPSPSPESSPAPESEATPSPPPVPKTESPIPLNEFGLPPQILPLGRINPGYQYTQLATYPYTYPGLRFYDPYDPFGFHTYANWPLYQPLTNFIGQSLPLNVKTEAASAPAVAPTVEDKPSQSPPSEPSDLNVLNYSAKDPAIPNVPPPPLPQGGLKPDNE